MEKEDVADGNGDKVEEYGKSSDPQVVPHSGSFFMHDDRGSSGGAAGKPRYRTFLKGG